ncbi:MAG: dTMP kinase [Ndongobacter sp.]|nr:dTMP kinase [Ndongobacter sp.]
MSGLFVTLEGPDGSGKTTVAELLRRRMNEAGMDFVMTREPGGTPISEKIRGLILDTENREMDARCEALLYAASRAQHTEQLIRPALQAGKLVLCDRYVLSSLAYQGAGRALGMDAVASINAFATKELQPDLVLFLDVDPVEVLRRKAREVEQDRLEEAGGDFHRRVYDGYREALRFAESVLVIDASRCAEQVAEEAWKAITAYWEKRK